MREIRDGLPKPFALLLQLLQALQLIRLQATKLLTPPIVVELRHADRPNSFGHRLALQYQDVNLQELGDGLTPREFLNRSAKDQTLNRTNV